MPFISLATDHATYTGIKEARCTMVTSYSCSY